MGSVSAAYEPGLADWLTEHVSSDMADDAAAGLLENYCASTGLHAADNRGRSIREGFEQLVRWIRSRELIADAGIQTGTFPLFTFHVPPNGKGSIAWTSEAQGDGKFGLSVFGCGLGGKLSVKSSESFELSACKQCQAIFQRINVRIRRYRVHNGNDSSSEEVTVDPVEWLNHEAREQHDCCRSLSSEVSRFHYSIQEARTVDGRQTNASQKINRELSVKLGANMSAKLTCLTGFEAGLELESSGSLACKMTWEFPSGHRYLPYVPRSNEALPPQWAVDSWT